MRFLHPITFLIITLVLASCGESGGTSNTDDTRQLRVLAWVGYDEEEIIQPFEEEFNAEVLVETFTGADSMFALLSVSPDQYDVVVIDPEYIEKLNTAGLLSDLDESDYEFDDYIEPLREFELSWIDGQLKAVLVRFGINGLVYNTDMVSADEASSYQIMFSERLEGRVGIWDWYLPNMGILSLINGNSDPFMVSDEQTQQIENTMAALAPNVRAFLPSFSDVNAALARGDIWVVPAHGEHTAAVLADDGLPIAWSVPEEGAIMWVETLGIPPLAANRDLAIDFIQYVQRPTTLANLTWRRAYRSNTPSVSAIGLLTAEQQRLLHVSNAEDATDLVNSVHVRMLPSDLEGNSRENEWQDIWQRFKAGQLE